MTRFGPASAFGDILEAMRDKPPHLYKLSSSPFILAPTARSIGISSSFSSNNRSQQMTQPLPSSALEERVLLVSYCLIGEEWLCAAVTDSQGHLLDNVLINLTVSATCTAGIGAAEWKHRNRSQIFDSIQRLWAYIHSVLSMDTKNVRLVIGRLGKIGHGEFKAWNELLSKKSLRAFNNSLKSRSGGEAGGGCRPCSLVPGFQETPAILSACLVSTEPEPHLRVLTSSTQPTDSTTSSLSANGAVNGSTSLTSSSSSTGGNGSSKSSKAKALSQQQQQREREREREREQLVAVPLAEDPSITHIVSFPTIINIFAGEQQTGQQLGQEESALDDFFTEQEEDHHMEGIELDDMEVFDLKAEEETAMDNQPMAIGYYVSTAPALDLPDWFWSACPSARSRIPVHLKSSLHVQSGNILQSDELALGTKGGAAGKAGTSSSTAIASLIDNSHVLDSTATDEVLRFVLETYNALSWLNVDFAVGVRQSCLPVHIQAMLRLHKSVVTLFQ